MGNAWVSSTIEQVIFQPPPASYSDDKNLIWLKTHKNEDVPAFYCKVAGATTTVLFSH